MNDKRARRGDWVQIENVILEAGNRAPGIPEDTAQLPLLSRLKGFALNDATVGEELEIRTVLGREVTGKLVTVDPRYGHDFGGPIPELIEAGIEARRLLKGGDDLWDSRETTPR
ncbi:MAG: 2-amino-4-oxopentanoate thiolase subunit OrtA [Clostridia bacterium]